MGMSRWSTNYARLPSAAILTVCIYIQWLIYCMPYYDLANVRTVTTTNMISRNTFWLCKNNWCENRAPSLVQSCTAVSAALEVSRRSAQRSQELPNLTIIWVKSCSILSMLLKSLRAHCVAPEGSGSIRKRVQGLVRSPRVTGRIACSIWTNLRFADGTYTMPICIIAPCLHIWWCMVVLHWSHMSSDWGTYTCISQFTFDEVIM